MLLAFVTDTYNCPIKPSPPITQLHNAYSYPAYTSTQALSSCIYIRQSTCARCTTTNVTGGGVDYDSGPYTVTIPAGMASAPFNVAINDDNTFESREVFYLTIFSLPSRVTLSSSATLSATILDDDCK